MLAFADKLTLVTDWDEDAEGNMRVLYKEMTKWTLKINWEKTKDMVVEEEAPEVSQ